MSKKLKHLPVAARRPFIFSAQCYRMGGTTHCIEFGAWFQAHPGSKGANRQIGVKLMLARALTVIAKKKTTLP